jgi:hypothetical protein
MVVGAAVGFVVGLAVFPGSAGAAIPLPLHPTRTDDPSMGGTTCNSNLALDTDCSLRNALADAMVTGESVSLGSPSPQGQPYTVTQSTPLLMSTNINLVGVGARSSMIERTAGFPAGVIAVTSAVTVGATVAGVTITGGEASDMSGGGGISNAGVLTVRDSTLEGNSSASDGGGIENVGSLTVIGSTISGNTAATGGGVFADGPSFGGVPSTVLVNSTVSGNTQTGASGAGGGIFVTSTLGLANVTLTSNSAPGSGLGGNLWNKGTVSIKGTIIAGGMAASGTENCGFGAGTINSLGSNLEDRNQCGFASTGDQVNTDPMLGPLLDNGGQTDTQAPSLDSPAVDHGDPAGCTDFSHVVLTIDQRGFTRPQGLACDIGAYELQPVAPAASAAPATAVGTDGATLSGTIDTHGFQTTWQFRYGPTAAYGSSTAAENLAGGSQPVSATITGLLPGITYHFALVASTTGGSTVTADQTFTTSPSPGGSPGGGQPPGQPPGPGAAGAPALGPIAIAPSAFRAAGTGASIATTRRTGATVTYTDTQPSTAAFTVLQARPGVFLGGRCAAPPKHPLHKRERACTRYVAVGGFSHRDASGLNRFHFTGRVGGHKLPPGNYQLTATPHSNGIAGKNVSAHFRILR